MAEITRPVNRNGLLEALAMSNQPITTIGEKNSINFFLPILEDKAPPKGANMIPEPAAVAANHDPKKVYKRIFASGTAMSITVLEPIDQFHQLET